MEIAVKNEKVLSESVEVNARLRESSRRCGSAAEEAIQRNSAAGREASNELGVKQQKLKFVYQRGHGVPYRTSTQLRQQADRRGHQAAAATVPSTRKTEKKAAQRRNSDGVPGQLHAHRGEVRTVRW